MDKKSNVYSFVFALIVCAIASLTLATISEGLRPQQTLNRALDVRSNILKAVGLKTPLSAKPTANEIMSTFEEKIEAVVVDQNGQIVLGQKPADIGKGQESYPLYIYKEGSSAISFAFPVEGPGLWSTIYGYLALEADASTIRGITFYEHGETPGLGGEISRDWFQQNFQGKKVWDSQTQRLISVAVVKGQADKNSDFEVDGVSGATLTGQGVTDLLKASLDKYEPFLSRVRKGEVQ